MNDITSVSLNLKDYTSSEVDVFNTNSNGAVDCKAESDNCKVHDGDKQYGSLNKGMPTVPISLSMQDHQVTVMRSNKSLSSISTECHISSGSSNAVSSLNIESASFALLSRRESSLENLAEDENNALNACISQFVDVNSPIIVEKSEITENIIGTPKKAESSRIRRTLSSLLSCCTSKSRRSHHPYKSDSIIIPVGDNEATMTVEKCSNVSTQKQASSRSQDDGHISFSCIKLKKFLDIFDESDSPVRKLQQPVRLDTNRPNLTPIPRDGDKTDSPCKSPKNTEQFQSENGGANLTRPVLLGAIKPADQGKKCFIIDLDETLVHSSFKMVEKADFKVGVDIEGTVHTVYVLKRPYVDVFLQKMGRIFECVLFTASLAKYADPVTDFLDKWRVFRWRLFRESCVFHRGNYVKDLSMLGRHTDQVAILDNSPASYMFHPDNAVQITSWFDDPRDTALLDLIPYFEQLAAAPSVPPFLASVKPPQRATVPVSVMLTTPTSISLQPVSQHQLQHQQQQSFSPITSVDSSANATSADLHSVDDTSANGRPQPVPHFPNNALYIRDIDLQLPFSRSLRSLSAIASKSLPTIFSVESKSVATPLRTSHSEAHLNSIASSVFLDSPAVDSNLARYRHTLTKSTSDIPTVPVAIDLDNSLPLSLANNNNNVSSRSFPLLTSVKCHQQPSSNPVATVITNKRSTCIVTVANQLHLPRSASYSFQKSSIDKTNRSNSFSNGKSNLRNSLISDC